jgi:hypothetical protein
MSRVTRVTRDASRRASVVGRLSMLAVGAALIAGSVVLTGCRTRTWVDTGPNPVPADFALSLTVQRAAAPGSAVAGAAARGVRYQVEPDWVLRVATAQRGARVDELTPAAPAAQLTAEQMGRLVERLRADGLLNPDHPARVPRSEAAAPPAPGRGGASYLFTWISDGHRRTLAFADASQAPGGLAWLEGQLAAWSFIDRR